MCDSRIHSSPGVLVPLATNMNTYFISCPQFNYFPLLTMLLFYYWMACWAAGTYISSGLVVPMLLIGALYGRMLGKFMVDIFGVPETAYWDWLDPGTFSSF